MSHKRNIALVLSCIFISSLGCKTADVLTSKISSLKSPKSTEKSAAVQSIEASLREMSGSRNSKNRSKNAALAEAFKEASTNNAEKTARLVSFETTHNR